MLEWKAWGTGSHWGLILSKGTQVFRQSYSVHITQQEDPVHQRRGRWGLDGADASLRLREKALVPGRLMRAGLLTEGPPLKEDAIVCGSSKPQRSHFLWLMFHSELPALPGTALSIRGISDNAAELITCMGCRMYALQSVSMHPGGTYSFFMGIWARLCTCVSSLFSMLCFLSLKMGVIAPQGAFAL